jgi:four helix bundle protein
MTIRSFRDLEAWQLGMDLVIESYRITRSFPREEQFGLTTQLRRAAVSVPSNIAEGHNRGATGAYINHLSIALGSEAELQTILEIAVRLGYVATTATEEAENLSRTVGRMLRALIGKLELHR